MFGQMMIAVGGLYAEAKARKAYIDSLPEDIAKSIRADEAKKASDDKLHRRELEIAEAGRPRNFWGN